MVINELTIKIQPHRWIGYDELLITVLSNGQLFSNSKAVKPDDLQSMFDVLFDHGKYELKLALEKADAAAKEKSQQ
jgi:hypothetical protein